MPDLPRESQKRRLAKIRPHGLAFVTVFAVQTFDDIAVFRAGEHADIPPFAPFFDKLKRQPGDPEYWWLWLILFSALIPSAVNLCFAAASLSAACRS